MDYIHIVIEFKLILITTFLKNYMKIIKKIAKYQGIFRVNEVHKDSSLLTRAGQHRFYSPLEIQLQKYGSKFNFNRTLAIYILGGISAAVGLLFHKYYTELYKNQIRARYRYGQIENQKSKLIALARLLYIKYELFVQSNLHLNELFASITNKKINEKTEATIRYNQYKNFQAKRNKLLDFNRIGIYQRFPFPEHPKAMDASQ